MKRPNRASKAASQSFNTRLDRYVLAASAAGVGWLAMAQPADAEILYTHVNQTIPFDTTYNLDLNNDGIVDFQIKNHEEGNLGLKADLFMLPVAKDNRAAGEKFAPSVLPGGVTIGSDTAFPEQSVGKLAEWFYSFSSTGGVQYRGNWRHASNRYLGLKFVINGEVHYGWARLSVSCIFLRPVSAKITGYAYETEANKSIDAGQTKESGGEIADASATELLGARRINGQAKSLGVLALGSPAMAAWRREEESID